MTMTADDIVAHPALPVWVRNQAEVLVLTHQASPRVASPFGTQQRWLMAQAALGAYFRNEARQPGSGVLAQHFIELAVARNIASRNTASSFINEMRKYGFVRYIAASASKRYRPLEPSPIILAMLLQWLSAHLATLDGLDGGSRSAALRERPAMLGAIQPLIADGLQESRVVRRPRESFSLFTWIHDGGIVMDRLIAGFRPDFSGLKRIPTDIMSVSALARLLSLSRSQLSRKFATAEAMGSLGWSGASGKSALWVSAEFWREYRAVQAVKLAIIDAAVAAASAQDTTIRQTHVKALQSV
jgi:hypothetical protein